MVNVKNELNKMQQEYLTQIDALRTLVKTRDSKIIDLEHNLDELRSELMQIEELAEKHRKEKVDHSAMALQGTQQLMKYRGQNRLIQD